MEYEMILEYLQKMKQKEQQKKVENPIEIVANWIENYSKFIMKVKVFQSERKKVMRKYVPRFINS